MLEIRRLRLLRELQSRRTVSAVAHALSFSPSAVSQQLAQLEREAGVPLLEKIGRNVRLTDAGRLLVTHADALLARIDEAEADLSAAAGAVQGALRVGTFQTAGVALLEPALAALADAHPALAIGVLEADPEETLPALLLGDLDLVIADEYDGDPRPRHRALEREDLMYDPLRLTLPIDDPLASAEGPVRLADFADRAWAVGRAGSSYANGVGRACNHLGGFDPQVRHHASDLQILVSLVRSTRAVAFLPDLLGLARDDTVAVRSIAEGTFGRTIYTTVRHASERRPSIVALRQALADAAKSVG